MHTIVAYYGGWNAVSITIAIIHTGNDQPKMFPQSHSGYECAFWHIT